MPFDPAGFTILGELGRGHSCRVYLAQYTDGRQYALKTIAKADFLSQPELLRNIQREIAIMRTLSHINVLRIFDVIESDEFINVILEYISGGTLFLQLHQRGCYSEEQARDLIQQLLHGLEYLHSFGVVHRDLKPENLLFEVESGRLVIADFGLANVLGANEDHLLHTQCGTFGYAAPEVLLGLGYTAAVDLWAVAIITFIVIAGEPPFKGTEHEIMQQMQSAQFDYTLPAFAQVSPHVRDFIQRLAAPDPTQRPTASQALAHPWMAELCTVDTILSVGSSIEEFLSTYF